MVLFVLKDALDKIIAMRGLSHAAVIDYCVLKDEAESVLAGGPTRFNVTLDEICRCIHALPSDFCKYKDEETDNSMDIEAIMKERAQNPLDPDESHYHVMGPIIDDEDE